MQHDRCWMEPCGSVDCAEFGPKDCPRRVEYPFEAREPDTQDTQGNLTVHEPRTSDTQRT